MQPIRVHTGTALPLDRANVDTDQIIPAEWLKRVERTGFGEGLFSEWRKDPEFVLNDPRYAGASVLVAGPSFGIGSSREHAVWALEDYGFRAVIAPSFSDIFRNNCTKVGVVPAVVSEQIGTMLLAAIERVPSLEITIDVAARELRCAALSTPELFDIDEFTQHRLLEGLDDIGLTLRHDAEISDFEQHRPGAAWLPATN